MGHHLVRVAAAIRELAHSRRARCCSVHPLASATARHLSEWSRKFSRESRVAWRTGPPGRSSRHVRRIFRPLHTRESRRRRKNAFLHFAGRAAKLWLREFVHGSIRRNPFHAREPVSHASGPRSEVASGILRVVFACKREMCWTKARAPRISLETGAKSRRSNFLNCRNYDFSGVSVPLNGLSPWTFPLLSSWLLDVSLCAPSSALLCPGISWLG